MFFLTIGMYLVTFDLIKKIGAGANFGEGGSEKQLLFFYHGLMVVSTQSARRLQILSFMPITGCIKTYPSISIQIA